MPKLITTSIISATLLTFSSLTQAVITTVDFDTDPSGTAINAPDLFTSGTPLTELYSDSGVHFSALERKSITSEVPHNGVLTTITRNELMPSIAGMGAILNDSSGFGGSAKSGDNFLAFNGETDFSSHFWRISFDNPIGYFGVNQKKGAGIIDGYLNFDAYDVDGNLIGSRNHEYTFSSYSLTEFKSDAEISYIDIGHALDCCNSNGEYEEGGNAIASLQPNPWALVYDDLVFGGFDDAAANVSDISGDGVFVPLPGSIWLLLTGLFGFSGLITKRK
jgi:hypothetical protein